MIAFLLITALFAQAGTIQTDSQVISSTQVDFTPTSEEPIMVAEGYAFPSTLEFVITQRSKGYAPAVSYVVQTRPGVFTRFERLLAEDPYLNLETLKELVQKDKEGFKNIFGSIGYALTLRTETYNGQKLDTADLVLKAIEQPEVPVKTSDFIYKTANGKSIKERWQETFATMAPWFNSTSYMFTGWFDIKNANPGHRDQYCTGYFDTRREALEVYETAVAQDMLRVGKNMFKKPFKTENVMGLGPDWFNDMYSVCAEITQL